MIIDEPGLPGIPYIPPRPRPTAPKPKPKPRPVYRPPARPVTRPPGVAAPYRPKPKTTSPLRPANFSSITASARSRVTNTYAPGAGTPYAKPTYGAAPAPPTVFAAGPWTQPKGYDPRLFKPTPFGPWDETTTKMLKDLGYFTRPEPIPTAQRPAKGKAGNRGGSGGGYYPRAYYGGGGSYGGGGGGGGGGSEFERYGMTKDWMEAYKTFWGHALPSEYYGMFSPVQELFSRYQSRLPQLDDWQRIWQSAKDYMVGAGKDAKNMPKNLALYEPWIAGGVRPPLFTPPAISYAPTLSF